MSEFVEYALSNFATNENNWSKQFDTNQRLNNRINNLFLGLLISLGVGAYQYSKNKKMESKLDEITRKNEELKATVDVFVEQMYQNSEV